jgi:hypothetical protein
MKKRLAVVLAVAGLIVCAGGAWYTERYWSRTICWSGHPPDRIGIYERGDTITAHVEDLTTGLVGTRPPVVLDLPSIGLCPTVADVAPMVIWVRLGERQFVAYRRGGGP